MAPPKKRTTAIEPAANFFQRGKKLSTVQRVVAAKKATTPSLHSVTSPTMATEEHQDAKKDKEEAPDEIDETEYSDEEKASLHSDQGEDEAHSEEEEEEEDEVQSDDSDAVEADLRKIEKAKVLEERITTTKKGSEIQKQSVNGTASLTGQKKTTKSTNAVSYVAPYIGDIYAGFHQANLLGAEKVLRQFDLTSKYGPCTELTRLERWERALELGLDPPQDVKDMIVAHMALNTPVYEGRV
ncbi:DNA polymerase delta, subunit 4-domain-containing protein [Gamsiella multidivaricata]|uniref:DNA polymerase delta, subunit 4-domain-containing protein n=1 Tax=Gamsiella multidivaricata TaxID=101098 RepID=UPI00221F158A|nr:DNA polymerase delta, subunit 4-domain-containing protein [Gamsiella multidivaricata]KAG0355126.1 hypothetical protein BGZ54_001286 [Gamsiella multidivaricata]KAI7828613.1 DNA polymerase delta, subunit 4-domain-containing protein [Gamsiella multidivaricata]